MVTQITPSPQRAYSLLGVFCPRSHLSSSPWNRRHISLTWITKCQLITGFGPKPETCPHLIPYSSQWHYWECWGCIWEEFYSLSAFFFSKDKHMSQKVWCISALPQASTCQSPTAVELVSTPETQSWGARWNFEIIRSKKSSWRLSSGQIL